MKKKEWIEYSEFLEKEADLNIEENKKLQKQIEIIQKKLNFANKTVCGLMGESAANTAQVNRTEKHMRLCESANERHKTIISYLEEKIIEMISYDKS